MYVCIYAVALPGLQSEVQILSFK